MDCALDRHLLEGYLDGELGFERALEVEAHLASCRGCASEVQSWKDVRGALQSSDLYHRAPAKLEEKIRELVPQDNRGGQRSLVSAMDLGGGRSRLCSSRAVEWLS